MKRLILLIAVMTAAVSAYAARTWSLTDTLLDGKVSETFLHNHDMAFQMRGSLRADMPRGEDPSVHFRMDNFRWNIEGRVGKNREIYYQFRQSFNANFRSNTFDNLLESVDYAYMAWTPVRRS